MSFNFPFHFPWPQLLFQPMARCSATMLQIVYAGQAISLSHLISSLLFSSSQDESLG